MQDKNKKSLWLKIWEARYLYLLILPLMAWIVIFCYGPMYGLVLAFKEYKANLGILGSPWVGLKHFKRIFLTDEAILAIRSTLEISFAKLIFCFPVPIVVALMFSEMRGARIKKIFQTILTFPNFLSWVVVGTILENFLSLRGGINVLLENLGMESIKFLSFPELFRPILYATSNWKGAGWSAIIYMAAIAGIDPTLYDAAKVDGATRFKQIWHVTLPAIKPTIAIMFILQIGGLMSAGFDQIFNLRNATIKQAAQVLDTYIYDITFGSSPNYGFSTAVGLFVSVVNFILLIVANKVVHKLTGEKLFG